MSGPYETEQDARRAAHAVIAPEGGSSVLSFAQNHELLRRALDKAGVRKGAYGDRIARWLSQWTDATVEVIADWVAQAASHGMRRPVAFDLGDDCDTRFVLTEALEDWKMAQLEKAGNEGGNEARVRWAARADAMVCAIVAAAAEGED